MIRLCNGSFQYQVFIRMRGKTNLQHVRRRTNRRRDRALFSKYNLHMFSRKNEGQQSITYRSETGSEMTNNIILEEFRLQELCLEEIVSVRG
jgi:hypothetical protein